MATMQRNLYYFLDSFESNSNNWSERSYDNSSKGKIRNGFYYWESKANSPKTTYNSVYIDTSKDFEIEGSFKVLSASKKSLLHSLIFGGNGSKRFFFGYTKAGSYRISFYNGTSYEAIKDWTASSIIEKNGSNVLTIRKVKSRMYFFINRKLIHSTYFRSFYGNDIGFQASSNSEIRINYLKVSYFKKSKKEYDAVSYDEKDYFFSDYFEDNRNNWSTGTEGKSKGVVEYGSYTWSSFVNSGYVTQKTIEIDESRDFEIEANLKFVSGNRKSGVMLHFGRGDRDNYNFEITGAGSYWIGKQENGKYIASKGWTKDNYVFKGEMNKLTVRKVGNKYYFYLNEKYKHTMNFAPFFGNKIGFMVPGNSTMKVGSIKIAYIDGKKSYNNNGPDGPAPSGN